MRTPVEHLEPLNGLPATPRVERGVDTVQDLPRKSPCGLVRFRRHGEGTRNSESRDEARNTIGLVGVRGLAGTDPAVGILCAVQR
jgi:hypothetical protein